MTTKAKKTLSKAFVDESKPPIKIAVIPLHGEITRVPENSEPYISWDTHRKAIAEAFAWKQSKAVILDIDCPGGSPSETYLIAEEIRRQSEFSKKPVYAFVRGVAASGGYWIACSAKEIYALPVSDIGSIGVVIATFGYHKKNKKAGVERRVFTAGKDKVMLDPHQPLKKKYVKAIQEGLDEFHEEFINRVKQLRGDRIKGPDSEVMSGRHWSGRKALELGLVDGLGDMMGKAPELLGRKVSFKIFEPDIEISSNPLKDLLESLKESGGNVRGGYDKSARPKFM